MNMETVATTERTESPLEGRPRGRSFAAYPLFALALVLVSNTLMAGNWQFSRGLTLRGVYSDNINFSSSDKKSDFYTQIRPNLSINGEGARVKLNFNYAPGFSPNIPGERGRTISHRLQADAKAELYEDVLFLDASARANLNPVVNSGNTQPGNLGDTGGIVQTYTYSLSPYVRHHFGRYADLTTRYTLSQVINTGNQAAGSQGNQMRVSLESGTHFTRIPWGLNFNYSKIDYSTVSASTGRNDSEFSSVTGNAGYILNRKWRLNGSLGKSFNNFGTTRSSTDSITWSLGTTWTPNARTSLDLSYGRQFFGNNFGLSFSHRSRRTIWKASYSEGVTSSRSQQLQQGVFMVVDPFGNPLVNPVGGGPVLVSLSLPSLSNEYFLRKNFTTGFTLKTGRSTLGITGYYTQRIYEISQERGLDYGLRTNWGRRLAPTIRANTGLSWRRTRIDTNDPMSTRWTLNLGLTKELSTKTNASLLYQHRRRDSDDPAEEYRENRISLTLATRW